ncbi:hypothetical protein G9A89_022238 [Geosiphon pyriformis]|nr:hypothetical protein G9A89_022238 [Geosiphon pyriformis]
MGITLVLRGANLHWFQLGFFKCDKYEKIRHISLGCPLGEKNFLDAFSHRVLSEKNKSRLAAIYAKHLAPVAYSVSFSSASWAKIVDRLSFSPLFASNDLSSFGSFLEIESTPLVSIKLNNRFATLEHSLINLAEHNQEINIVISEGSDITTGIETIMEVVVFDQSVILKLKVTLKNFSVTIISLMAKVDNAGLMPVVHSPQ